MVATLLAISVSPAFAATKVAAGAEQAKPLTVTQLRKKEGFYDGKIVTVRGDFVAGIDVFRLEKPGGMAPIGTDEDGLAKFPDGVEFNCVSMENTPALKAMKFPRLKHPRYSVRQRVTVVGKFRAAEPGDDDERDLYYSTLHGCDSATLSPIKITY